LWNHAALIVSESGDLVEALARSGATRSHVSKYLHTQRTLVRTHAVPRDRAEILNYADRVVGEPYGLLNDACIFVSYLTGCKLNIATRGHVMCAGLVGNAQLRAGAYFSQMADWLAPADLALAYNVLD
jgi:hypothetical protein